MCTFCGEGIAELHTIAWIVGIRYSVNRNLKGVALIARPDIKIGNLLIIENNASTFPVQKNCENENHDVNFVCCHA